MANEWSQKQPFPVFSLACLEGVWRTVVELLEVGDLVLLPIGGLLVSREFLNATEIGCFLGLLLLGIATFQTLPEVFPDRYLGWGNDVAARALVAGGVVAAASLFNGLMTRLPLASSYLDAKPFALTTTVVTLVGVSAVAGLMTSVYKHTDMPQLQPLSDSGYVRYRPQDGGETGFPPVGVLVSRVLLILVFGGYCLLRSVGCIHSQNCSLSA